MRMKSIKVVTIFTILALLTVTGFAQYVSQIEEEPTLERAIKLPGSNNNTGVGLLNPNRFSMSQSYSMAVGFGGNGNSSIGMYMNNMSYILSKDLILNARLGFMHNPLQMGNNLNNSNLSNNLI